MVSLGHFSYDEHSDGTGEPDQEFAFLDAHRDHHLFSTPNSQLRVHLYLGTHHDAARGTLTHLDLAVRHYDWAGGKLKLTIARTLDSYQLPICAGVSRWSPALRTRSGVEDDRKLGGSWVGRVGINTSPS